MSMCIIGVCCRYNGKKAKNILTNSIEKKIKINYNIIPVCPEQLGGMSTPRLCCEIIGGDGFNIIDDIYGVNVINSNKENLTKSFLKGAEETLKIAKFYNTRIMITQSNSPSCSSCNIYDGSFNSSIIKGFGVTSAYLKKELNMNFIDVLDLERWISLW